MCRSMQKTFVVSCLSTCVVYLVYVDKIDGMTDKEYLYAFLKMTQEEKESLMVSEAERRRTYTAHWPIESIVKAADLAKEGFYYTG